MTTTKVIDNIQGFEFESFQLSHGLLTVVSLKIQQAGGCTIQNTDSVSREGREETGRRREKDSLLPDLVSLFFNRVLRV